MRLQWQIHLTTVMKKVRESGCACYLMVMALQLTYRIDVFPQCTGPTDYRETSSVWNYPSHGWEQVRAQGTAQALVSRLTIIKIPKVYFIASGSAL